MRNGFDPLWSFVRKHMSSNFLLVGVYIFVNRKRSQIKLLQGLALWLQKAYLEVLPGNATGKALYYSLCKGPN